MLPEVLVDEEIEDDECQGFISLLDCEEVGGESELIWFARTLYVRLKRYSPLEWYTARRARLVT